MRSSRLLPFLWSSLATVAVAQTPVAVPPFAGGDVARLSCRVLGVTEKRDVRQLQIEVQNAGPLAAEPLEFELEVADAKAPGGKRREIFRRVQLPLAHRFGRPVPAGGKQVYPVATLLPIARGTKGVQVRTACWYDGPAVPAPQLSLGAPQMVQRESLAGTFNVTEVEVGNPFDRDLDVLLRVTLAQPFDTVELMGLRLAAGQRRAWILPSLAGSQPYLDEMAVACHLRATAFEVVDWCLCAPNDPEAAAALLRPAYERCYRWPAAVQEVSGRFVYRGRCQRANQPGEYDDVEARGRYTLRRGADPVVEFEAGNASGTAGAIAAAFEYVAWPAWDVLQQRNELVLVADDRVGLRGPQWGVSRGGAATALLTGGGAATVRQQDMQVAGDRITSVGYDDTRTVWELRDGDRGCLVTRTTSPTIVATFAYGTCDGEFVPVQWSMTQSFGGKLYSSDRLELSAPTFAADARVAPAPPTGPGAAALRAIWDAGYRLPAEPLRIEAGFTATNPGVEQFWRGRKKVSGRMVTTGFGRHMQTFHVDFDGKASPDLEQDLAFILRDRLLMWWLREFADRLPFDEFFAGAEIGDKQVDGSFAIEHGPVERVATQDGLLRGFRTGDGLESRLTWQTVGGQKVVQKWERDHPKSGSGARAWTEVMTVTWTPVGQHLLPTTIALEQIFGREFGTETITLKNPTVKESR